MKQSKVERAYQRLIVLIEDGGEFPDCVYAVTDELNLSDSQVAALERKYDSEPSSRAADGARADQHAADDCLAAL